MRYRMWGTVAGTAGLAGLLAACGGSGAASTTAAQHSRPASTAPVGTMIESGTVAGRDVLTDGAGMTLYWLAGAGGARPRCDAACLGRWPAAKAPAIAGPGVNFRALGQVKLRGGAEQITYAGHPLFTFLGDSKPGVARGDGLTVPGGVWLVATPSLKTVKSHRARGSHRPHARGHRTPAARATHRPHAHGHRTPAARAYRRPHARGHRTPVARAYRQTAA